MKQFVYYFLILLVFAACVTEEEPLGGTDPIQVTPDPEDPEVPQDPEKPVVNLNSTDTDVMVYQTVSVFPSEGSFTEDQYTGKFGDEDILLIRETAERAYFLVPNTGEGRFTLVVDLGDQQGELEFLVLAPAIEAAELLVEERIIQPLERIMENSNRYRGMEGLSGGARAALRTSGFLYSAFHTRFASLSPSRREALSLFLLANPTFQAESSGEYLRRVEAGELPCYDGMKEALADVKSVLAEWEEMDLLVSQSEIELFQDYGAISFVLMYTSAAVMQASYEALFITCMLPEGIYAETIPEKQYEPVANREHRFFMKPGSEDQVGPNLLNMINKEVYVVSLFIKNRTLTLSDLDSPILSVANTARQLNELRSSWAEISLVVNSLINVPSNWMRYWFSEYVDIAILDANLGKLPDDSVEIISGARSEYVDIILPTDVQFTKSSHDTYDLNLTLSTNNRILPKEFSGKVIYNDGSFSLENSFSIKMDKTLRRILEVGYMKASGPLDPSQIQVTHRLAEGDLLELPNNVDRFCRILDDGSPVTWVGDPAHGWRSVPFTTGGRVEADGTYNQMMSTEDAYFEDYNVNVNVNPGAWSTNFPVQLTLSNQAYRRIVGKTISFADYAGGEVVDSYYPTKIKFLPNGHFTGEGNYPDGNPDKFFSGTYYLERNVNNAPKHICGNDMLNNPIVGEISLWGGYHSRNAYFYIFADGTLRDKDNPYGCLTSNSGRRYTVH